MSSFRRRGIAVARCIAFLLPVLAHGADDLDEVTITASPLGHGDSLATLVESVDRDELVRRGAASLGDALSNVPGVSASGFAAGASRPIIRGLDSSRVRILENGIGSFDVADIGPDHGTPIDPLSADRIEIVRGAGTLRYGSQAIGGVVNTINGRVPVMLDADPLRGEASAAWGSAADSREGAGRIDGHTGTFAWHGDGFLRRTEDYDTPLGTQQGSWFDGKGGSLGAGFVGDAGRAGAAIVRYDAKYGLPNGDSYIDMRQDKLLVRGARDLGWGPLSSVTLDAGYADYEHAERESDGTPVATFLDEEWEARAEALFARVGPFDSSAIGAQFHRRRFAARGEAADYLQPTLSESAAVFAFGESALRDHLSLQLGARVESTSIDGRVGTPDRLARDFTPASGSVSLVYTPEEALQFGATIASSARAPAQTELFAQGPHDGSRTFETGDADLGLERANAAELTAHWRGETTHVEAALWGSRFSGFIYGAFTGRTCDDEGRCEVGDAGDLRELVYGQRDARFRGAELSVEQQLGYVGAGRLKLRAQGDLVRAGFPDGGGNVPRIPPWKLAGTLAWESALVDAEATLRHAGRQDRPGELDTPTPGWTSLDAQLAFHPGSADALEFALIGRNLTDTRQRNAASFTKDEVLMPGRDVRLLVRARF